MPQDTMTPERDGLNAITATSWTTGGTTATAAVAGTTTCMGSTGAAASAIAGERTGSYTVT